VISQSNTAPKASELIQSKAVYNWYSLAEGFSGNYVADVFKRYSIRKPTRVLDPFAGAGTTLVTCKLLGISGRGIDINPFLCFASKVKTRWDIDVEAFEAESHKLIKELKDLFSGDEIPEPTIKAPAMPRLHRWVSPKVLRKLLLVKERIARQRDQRIADLMKLAYSSILRPSSNMVLRPSSFGSRKVKQDAPVTEMISTKLSTMIQDLKTIRAFVADDDIEILEGDARELDTIADGEFQLSVFSPPYLNNLDYTMQTRLELFFLDFVRQMEDVRNIRKRMIICDAKAGAYKDIHDSEFVKDSKDIMRLSEALEEKLRGRKWGWNYPRMVTEYFGGMVRTLRALQRRMEKGGRVIIVVGESAHYGILVDAPRVIGTLGKKSGFTLEDIETLRYRRCSSHKFHLKEAAVILRKDAHFSQ